MHISYRNFALAGAAMALAMTPAIVGAQDSAPTGAAPQDAPASMPQTGPLTQPPASPTSTPPVEAEADPATSPTDSPVADEVTGAVPPSDTAAAPAPRTLTPADQQAAMQTWPAATQEYYKALTAERQEMFWALSDADKVRLSELPEPQRETAWAQIAAQFPPKG